MKQFLVIYKMNDSAKAKIQAIVPEEQVAGRKAWIDWQDSLGNSMLQKGNPVSTRINLASSGETEADKDVAGYSVIQAENMDEAKKLLQSNPHLDWDDGATMDVFEVMPM